MTFAPEPISSSAVYSRKKDTPMAVISSEMRGALRSGV